MIGERFQPKAAFRALRIIFYAMNTGLLLFLLVAVYLIEMKLPPFHEGFEILTFVNVVLLAAIPIGYSLSSKRMEAIDPADSFPRKFEQYSAAMIIRWAMIEGVALFSLVGLIILKDSKQLVLFVICILILSANTVTKEKATRLAKLNAEEARALND